MSIHTILEKFNNGAYNELDGQAILQKDLKELNDQYIQLQNELDNAREECQHVDALLDKMKG